MWHFVPKFKMFSEWPHFGAINMVICIDGMNVHGLLLNGEISILQADFNKAISFV